MHRTNLRKVGGSVMVAVPPAFLDQLHLRAGATVGLSVADGRLVLEPAPRPRYALDELLAEIDPAANADSEARAWIQEPPCGGELI